MKTPPRCPKNLSDQDLIAEVARLARCERNATTELLRSLMEFDARRLYLGESCPSLFVYCTRVLRYAEHAALNRIEVARAARRFPALLDCIAAGRLHLSGARLLAAHLTEENCEALLAAAEHKSKREIEEVIAALRPRPPVPPMVRRLTSRPPSTPAPPAPARSEGCASAPVPTNAAEPISMPAYTKPVVTPLAPERYKVQFTITGQTRDTLRRVQDLMRHTIPDGDPGLIFARALMLLLDDLHRKRIAATARPRAAGSADPQSRHIPAAIRREVWKRDDGRCAFVGSHGRCDECGFLEFHHVLPFAAGGSATLENVQLRCRAQNGHEASLFFTSETGVVVRETARPWG